MYRNKLGNVRRSILKNRFTSVKIKEIWRIATEPTNSKKKNPKDVRVRIENMTPGQIKDKVEKIRQENQIKINEVKEKVGPP